ncbi:MAG TPA: hypothetical protein VGK19_20910 [Capsulimonadaceae bacterium]|jgi:hypothetical protein
MFATRNEFTEIIEGLTPELVNAEAAVGFAPAIRPKLNAHIHLPPNFTAFGTTEQAVELADAEDVRVLGASNYYDYSIYVDFGARAARRGIFPLFGLEIIALIDDLVASGVKLNDPGNPGKMYICGKGITQFDPMPADAGALLQVIRNNDSKRMEAITVNLARVFADAGVETGLDAAAIKQRVVARHDCPLESVYLQERHVAQAFQEVIFEKIAADDRAALLEKAFGTPSKSPSSDVTVQNEIRSHLLKAGKPAFAPDTFVDFDHAYKLILALGGIPCYPTLADGTSPITPFEGPVSNMIAQLQMRGIPAAEFIPNRNSPEVLSEYVHALRKAGLFVTAGTEHNTRDLIAIEPVCAGDEAIPADVQDIFWEGACVVAAHQFLTLHGRPGFVDAKGAPNPAYATADERIKAFAKVGAALLENYMLAAANRG